MKLASCRIDVVMLPTRRPHRWTGIGANVIGHYPIIRLRTDNGLEGLGEAPVLPTWGGDYGRYFGEDIETVIHVVRDILFPSIRNEIGNPVDIPRLLTEMDKVIIGYPYAKAAIDMALHDIVGKQEGKPVYDVLGGKTRDGVLVSHSIGLMDPAPSAKEAEQAVNEGIRAIKIKIGMGKQHDASVVAAVREAVGESITIGVDANQGYSDCPSAIESLKEMEQFGLLYAEQPVEGLDNLTEVAKGVDVPVIADESAWTAHDVKEIMQEKRVEGISVYTTKPGGLYRAMQILRLIRGTKLLANVNGSCETGVGNAANIHLGIAGDTINLPSVVPVTTIRGREQTRIGGVFYTDDVIKDPFKYENGYIYPPSGPGLGIELDESKVDLYRSKFYPKPIISS